MLGQGGSIQGMSGQVFKSCLQERRVLILLRLEDALPVFGFVSSMTCGQKRTFKTRFQILRAGFEVCISMNTCGLNIAFQVLPVSFKVSFSTNACVF